MIHNSLYLLILFPHLVVLPYCYIWQNVVFFFFNPKKLFIYFWLSWVFVAACSLSLVVVSGLLSSCGPQAPHCGGFSCCGAQALECVGFGSCDAQAWLSHSLWNLPRSGIKPVSQALAEGFLTTGSPGKPRKCHYFFY